MVTSALTAGEGVFTVRVFTSAFRTEAGVPPPVPGTAVTTLLGFQKDDFRFTSDLFLEFLPDFRVFHPM